MALRSTFPSRSFLIFLVIGLAIRVWNLPSPLIDSMAPRQAQTADAIRSFIEEPGFQMDSNVSWRGENSPRLVQELPVYNILAQGAYEVLDLTFYGTHPPKTGGADPHLIDLAARLVSVFFWGLTFFLLQSIWSRFLSQREAFWANGVFVFAPLSVFFGQTVMPEMVFLAAATGFLVAVLRYGETPTLGRFVVVFLCGLVASLIKLPAFSHLGLLAVALLWRERGFRFLLRPTHWIAAFVLLVSLKGWGGYVTAVNSAGFPEWTSESTLRMFFGDPMARLKPILYIKVAGYITAFVLSPVGIFIAAVGLWQAFRIRQSDKGFFILAWIASLAFYVLVWGTQTAGAHSYYNLPMLIPCAMLFGMGMGGIKWKLSTGDGRWKMGDRRWEIGDGRSEMEEVGNGKGKSETGEGRPESGGWRAETGGRRAEMEEAGSGDRRPEIEDGGAESGLVTPESLRRRKVEYEGLRQETGEKKASVYVSVIVALLVLVPMGIMTSYLFREDKALMAAADWIRANVPEGRTVGVKLNHSPHYIDYFHVPTVSYYSGRKCFVIGRTMPDDVIRNGLADCDVIVETLPQKVDGMQGFAIALKGAARPQDTMQKPKAVGFVPAETVEGSLKIWRVDGGASSMGPDEQ